MNGHWLGIVVLLCITACSSADSSLEIGEWNVRFQRIPAGCEFIGFESDTGERGNPVARFECGEEGVVGFSRVALDDAAGRLRREPTFIAPLTMEWLAPAEDVVWRLEGQSVGADLLQRFAITLEPTQP